MYYKIKKLSLLTTSMLMMGTTFAMANNNLAQQGHVPHQKEKVLNQKENVPHQKEKVLNEKENVLNQKEKIPNQKKNYAINYEIFEPTGLHQIINIIDNDRLVNAKFTKIQLDKAKSAATKMNQLIQTAIKVNGLANNGVITISDTLEINKYLVDNHLQEWILLFRDYNAITSVSEITALNENAIKNVWGSVYYLGLRKLKALKALNNQHNYGNNINKISYFLNEITKSNLASFKNRKIKKLKGTTGTRLDIIANLILKDRGLLNNVHTNDLREGVRTANEMNKLIIEAIKVNGLANDKKISTADARTINNYLVANHLEKWKELHGDDNGNIETGYHKVQNDGATTKMYGDNVMNTIADGVYHLGFKTKFKDKLTNEDGAANQTFEDVAWWLDLTLRRDMRKGKLKNKRIKEVKGNSGIALDKIVKYIYNDEGLLANVSTEDLREGARSANEMNKLILEAIKETGVARDKYISTRDVKILNSYLVRNHAEEWIKLHGDDEVNLETGYHRVQDDGAVGQIENKNTIDKLADGIYHLGFKTNHPNNLVNEDGAQNVTFSSVAYWMNKYFKRDLLKGNFK